MNWFQFGRLIRSIYRKGGPLPDIEWIQSLGLLAVKLGQVHALRIDFLEPQKCQHLAQLYRQNSPLQTQDFRALLGASGIHDFELNFADIEQKPLATASVGQVHRAKLNHGDQVVIKVLKADVRDSFSRDVRSLKRFFRLAGMLYPPLRRVGDPVGILQEIEQLTRSELDLRNEPVGQRTLKDIHRVQSANFDLTGLRFPRIYEELSNDRVLVSEFIDAPSMDELLELGRLDYSRLLELFRIHGFYMFVIGMFHGDLHPGNVLVSDEEFFFVDTAFVGRVNSRLREGLFDFFDGLTRYEYAECARALHRMSLVRLDDAPFATFCAKFEALYSDFRGASVADVSLTKKMMQTIRLGVQSGMSFDRGMFSIIRSLMYMDGMVLRCKPDAVLIEDMRPAIEELLEYRRRREELK